MENKQYLPVPPWDMDSAAARLQLIENDYNSLDAQKISDNFTEDAEVRFGTSFINGREAIRSYLEKDLANKSSFQLSLDLWGALKGRMAVRFTLEWKDAEGKFIRSFGVQVFQFNDDGLISMNFSSFNDLTG